MNADNVVFIDAPDALNRLGNNKKLYAALLKKFNGELLLGELIETIKSGDTSASAAQAHKIKGLAANLSLKDLKDKSESIEMRIKSGAYPDINSMDTTEIELSVECTAAAVNDWIKQNT